MYVSRLHARTLSCLQAFTLCHSSSLFSTACHISVKISRSYCSLFQFYFFLFYRTPHPFTNISTVDNLWQWLNEDFLDTLYWETWYNGEHVTEEKVSVPRIKLKHFFWGGVGLLELRS